MIREIARFKVSMDTTDLLYIFDSLPDLLAIAREQATVPGVNLYDIQDTLREEYRRQGKPFKWSMPYRHLYQCPTCGNSSTAIQYELENLHIKDELSPLHRIVLWEEEVHMIREHEGRFSEVYKDFLRHVAAG